jgi:tetratricopeptide (TPR) repeat protein
MTFQMDNSEKGLVPNDFDLFAFEFAGIVQRLIPYADGPVSFIALPDQEEKGEEIAGCTDPWQQNVRKVAELKRPLIGVEERIVYLPVWSNTEIAGIGILEGVEASFIQSVSIEWLHDRSRIISRELSLSKQLFYDPISGLLNIRYLKKELSNLLEERSHFTLVFIDIYPKANNTEKARRYISKAGYYLGPYLSQQPLIHLDLGVFTFIWPGIDGQQAQKRGKVMLDLLKRENFNRAHLGMTTVVDFGNPAGIKTESDEELQGATIIDQAWQALLTARKRGPYALCPYDSISGRHMHPLAKPAPLVLSKMRQTWRRLETFAVVLLHTEGELQDEAISKRMLSLIGGQSSQMVISGQDVYVLLDGSTGKQALDWADTINDRVKRMGETVFTVGIAVYPMQQFKKSDTLVNAKKALLHTQFFGPGTVTIFDAVSQNISGDIYYREGDLKSAVREYRLGLALDAVNINLLNSLGEAYAQMNRHREAIAYFTKAIEHDTGNYMALFNLGVVHYKLEEDEQAVKYFEMARNVSERAPHHDGNGEAKYDLSHDLLLPLGRLYCKTGRYRDAVELLIESVGSSGEGVDEAERKSMNRGGVLRYLGKAYKGLDKNLEAITVLQRAIRHNPRDATSLSLLGELYCQEKQGNEIALSLCSQAVELDDSRWDHWYRLGWVRFQCGDIGQARSDLQESITRNPRGVAAKYLLGQVYQHQGEKKAAVREYKKVLRLMPSHPQVADSLDGLLQNNRLN